METYDPANDDAGMVLPGSNQDWLRCFGQVVRSRRAGEGMTQEELANLAGISRNYVSQVEKGTRSPTLSVARGIAEALDITAGQLVQETDERAASRRLKP